MVELAQAQKRVLVTGAAGFIGLHVASRLLSRGDEVIGVDNLNSYYDPQLKRARLGQLRQHHGFRFELLNIEDRAAMAALFDRESPQQVVHLAAQAGVRHSLEEPHAYGAANLQGFLNVLEGCRCWPVEHLVFASSSSVYGANTLLPYGEEHPADHPLSLYAATKRAAELMAHSYAHLFRLPITGARLFTVYGPWYRPDMALYRFARAMLAGEPLELYNEGRMVRDFTYVDDVADALIRLLDKPAAADPQFDRAQPDPARSDAPFRIFNVGGAHPLALLEVVQVLEDALGLKARRKLLPLQPGDVPATAARTTRLAEWIGPCPVTPLQVGIGRFAEWFMTYHERR